MSLISVIVPVYKVEPYLSRCVDSILNQTFGDIEVILVDDGSPDNCPYMCDRYSEIDRRVHVIHKENGGLSSARNSGIDWVYRNSDSDWIAFVDSDDWIHPKMLEVLLHAAMECKTKISMCRPEKTDRFFLIEQQENSSPLKTNSEDAYVEEPLSVTAWGKLYAKECFREIRYPLNKLHEDEFVTYKIILPAKNVAVVPSNLYYYFINSKGIMNSDWTPKRLAVFEALKEQYIYFRENQYYRAMRDLSRRYVYSLATQYKEMEDGENIKKLEKKLYIRYFKKEMKIALRRCKRNQVRFSVHQDPLVYEIAYPTFMRFYWVCKVAKKKLIHRRNDL